MRQIKEYIVEAKKKEHDDMINVMSKFYDDETPKVGIFWYDLKNKVLFGVEKDDVEFKVDEHWNIGHGWAEDKF